MKQFLFVSFLALCLKTTAQFQWAKSIGANSSSGFGALGLDVTCDANGNSYTIGNFRNTVDFDPGPGTHTLTSFGSTDIFVTKLDASGNLVWTAQIGSDDNDDGYTIAVDGNGDVIIGGDFRGTADFDPGAAAYTLTAGSWDAYICKLSSAGNFMWVRAVGSTTTDAVRALAVDATGNIYATGYFQNTADFDPGPGTFTLSSAGLRDVFVTKLDGSGNFVFAKRFGSSTGDYAYAIDVDAGGNVYTSGGFSGTVDFDPGAGTYTLSSVGDYDIFVNKLDASGNFVWTKQIGGIDDQSTESIAVDANGNTYFTGTFQSITDFDPGPATFTYNAGTSTDFFIGKLDPAGNLLWAKQVGHGSGKGIDIDTGGNVYTTGDFAGITDFDTGPGTYTLAPFTLSSMFVNKMDAAGNFIWAGRFGTLTQTVQIAHSIAVDNTGNIYLTGQHASEMDADPSMGTFSLSAAGDRNAYIIKVSNCLNAPVLPALISGDADLCANAGLQTYSIAPSSDALSYAWSLPGGWTGTSSSNTLAAMVGSSGQLSVTASNLCGTSFVSTIDVTVHPLPTLTISSTNSVLCVGITATLTAAGAATYTWNPGGAAISIAVSPTTTETYTISGTDNVGCENSTSFTQSVVALPSLTVSSSDGESCALQTVTLNASGASSYTWIPGIPGSSISIFPAATTSYSLTGIDVNGCENSTSFTQSVLPLPAINITTTHSVLCAGGSATLSAGGALTYTWSPGGNTETLTISPTGTTTYTLAGTDLNGCENLSTFTQSVSIPSLSVSSSNASLCAGESVTLTAAGASSYTWSPSGTGNSIVEAPSASFIYSISGTNVHGCQSSTTFTQSVFSLPVLTISSSSSAVCANQNVTLTANGASAYTWTPGGAGPNILISPTITSTYTLSGIDLNGCKNTGVFTQTVLTLPSLNISTSNALLCNGGTATLNAGGASSYTWNPGVTGASISISPNATSTYTLNATDLNGCENIALFTQTVLALPSLSISTSNAILCNGGTATLSASGASTYTWFPGGTGSSITISPNATTSFTLTGNDPNGCENTSSFTQTVSALPSLTVSTTNTLLCNGGTVTLNANGASTYTWIPGGTGSGITIAPNVTATYTLTGRDLNGCENTTSFTQSVAALPSLTVSTTNSLLCNGGTVTLNASGALNYTWIPGGAGSSISVSPNTTATYILKGKDLNGCENTSSFTQTVLALPSLSITSSNATLCIGESATLSANGASSFTWNPGGAGSNISISPAITSTYILTGADMNGCINSTAFTQSVFALPTVQVSSSNNTVCAGTNATLTATGASAYTWNPGGVGSTILILPTSNLTYTVSGTDLNGCKNSTTFTQSVFALPTILASSTSNTLCADGNATLTANGAVTFTWNPGGPGTTIYISPAVTTIYSVSGTDSNGCINSTTITQTVFPLPSIQALSSNTSLCLGQTATLTATGASNFTWNPGGIGQNIFVSPASTSTYIVSGTDSNGCKNSTSVTQTVFPLPNIQVLTSSPMLCAGETATLTASGAFTFTWIPGGIGQSIFVSPVITATYVVTGTDPNGCQNATAFTQSVSTCTGIYSVNGSTTGLSVYPNPSTGKFRISGNNVSLAQVYNSIGQLIATPVQKTENEIEIDLGAESAGIYFVRVGSEIRKIIKQ